MKALTYLTLSILTLTIAACDKRGNESGDTNRNTPAGSTSPAADGGTQGAGGTGGTGAGAGTGTTATGTGTGTGTNP
jgi:hypothetical protein